MNLPRFGRRAIGLSLLCVIIAYSVYVAWSLLPPASNEKVADRGAKYNYFPNESVSDFEQAWYGKHLSTMDEPVLSPAGKEKSYLAIRILYLPTWGQPIAIRYEKKEGGFFRRAVRLSGKGGYEPRQISHLKETWVDKNQAAELVVALEKAGFWTMPETDKVIGADGTQCIVEVVKDGEYRVRVRWSPEYESEERGLTALVSLYTSQFQAVGF